jgi:hypothetical protein
MIARLTKQKLAHHVTKQHAAGERLSVWMLGLAEFLTKIIAVL